MFISSLACMGCRTESDPGGPGVGLGALGFDPTSLIVPIVSSALKPGGGSTGGAAGGTSTQVSTQVSPQISPSFVQQFQPSGSPVNTSAVQGGTPITGAIPGFDAGGYATPNYGAGYVFPGAVQSTGAGFFSSMTTTKWAIIAGGIVVAAFAYKHRNRIATHTRSAYHRARRAVKAF